MARNQISFSPLRLFAEGGPRVFLRFGHRDRLRRLVGGRYPPFV